MFIFWGDLLCLQDRIGQSNSRLRNGHATTASISLFIGYLKTFPLEMRGYQIGKRMYAVEGCSMRTCAYDGGGGHFFVILVRAYYLNHSL